MKAMFIRLAILALIVYLPSNCLAWGMLGHRITGEIAQHYLSSKAKKEIAKILGNESVAMSSNWADFIKSDTTYNYLSTWHYVNFKAGLSFSDFEKQLLNDTSSVNAYNKLNFLIAELKKKSLELEKKRMYLRLLIHIVGDLHQPMHTGRPEDQGGNRIKVLWFSSPSNLHRVWDSDLIDHQQLSYTEYATAINFASKTRVKTLQSQSINEWIFDSYQVAARLYQQVSKPDEVLGYRYNYLNLETLNEQLLKGGIHLAGILNDIYKG